jgi:hypothetical protein
VFTLAEQPPLLLALMVNWLDRVIRSIQQAAAWAPRVRKALEYQWMRLSYGVDAILITFFMMVMVSVDVHVRACVL